ncbi:DNA (cytosine-5)-methyltransferase 3C [Frankliniella fusca]|uniref:DNA (Cytosine-5)-methyltransferase 3C n=1 Tax=Frankliniella fusca TaxID=407009 RepID=A0AAE1HN81_9NEOP|nr:DNA (cytosine-5)-methyltransferase 3C [Frankliniella fusca]
MNSFIVEGGSPRADLSLVNWRRRGFHGIGSSAPLFFEYVRVLEYLQSVSAVNGRPLHFLFENTAAMERHNREQISRQLLYSTLLTLGNIPNMNQVATAAIHEAPTLQEYLKPYHKATVSTLPTLTTSSASQRKGQQGMPPLCKSK